MVQLCPRKPSAIRVFVDVPKDITGPRPSGSMANTVAWWAGLQHAQGMSESESMRTFYFKFGIDIGTAQTLGERDVLELVDRVNVELLKNGIDGTVNAAVYLENL